MSARLKCLQTIIAKNGANKPDSEVSLDVLGIKTNEAEVLVRSGAAAWAKSAPVAVDETNVVEGSLAGVVDADGSVRDLEEMKRAELLEIAEGMDIPRASGMNKQQLIDAIKAESVEIDPAGDED